MHYGQNHFSKPPYNLTTIRTLDPAAQSIIGQRTVLSSLDVEKVNTMYNCGQWQIKIIVIVHVIKENSTTVTWAFKLI